jgi:drug/metabolite transporter (DMT)-like permease
MTSLSLTPYFLTLASNLAFGSASIVFARFSKSHSPMWVNQLKVTVAFFGFLAAFLLTEHLVGLPLAGNALLMLSGFMGLCIGDFFLFKSFVTLGPARTLVLFSFEPILMAIYGFAFLNQTLNTDQAIAIACMIACVITFVFERNKMTGKWDLASFLFAFVGILLDAVGVMCTRQAYELTPQLGSFQANLMRAIGAMIGFFILRPRSYTALVRHLKIMGSHERNLAIGASFIGTFVSLSLYLRALKTAHVATLTAISITLPVWVSCIEHVRDRSWPNRYLWCALILFLGGFAFMILGTHFS